MLTLYSTQVRQLWLTWLKIPTTDSNHFQSQGAVALKEGHIQIISAVFIAKHIQFKNLHWQGIILLFHCYEVLHYYLLLGLKQLCFFFPLSLSGLKDDLKSRLYGQHIASEVILKAVTGFMNNDNPQKPLVLSLQGTTGTGKNLASQLIVKNIYKKGMDSSFVHFFSAVVHFPDVDQVETYKVVWIMCLWFRRPVPVAVDWCMLSIL